MQVGLIIVAYNDAPSLERCITSVRATGFNGTTVIVDNASTDSTGDVAERLASSTPGVVFVRSKRNLGYAGGFNVGAEALSEPIIAVMGADCVLEGDWMSVCAEAIASEPSVAASSPTVALADGSGLNAEGLSLHKAGFGFNRNLGKPISTAATVSAKVDGIQGSAFVIKRSVLEAIGGWSEAGFLYHEDVELSWAVAAAGFDVWHVPTPFLVHDYQLTMSPEKFFLLERNRIDMLGAYLSIWMRLALSPVILATEVAVWAYAVTKRSGLPQAKWRSYRSAWSRRDSTKTRRQQIKRFRVTSESDLVGRMPLAYPKSQTRTLRTEQPSQGRRGGREMPTE
ncbi:MAG: glycosyltransferase family 2 protein [Acidimicrobiia bacterium]